MLTVLPSSSHEDGTMLAKSNPPSILILNTRQRSIYKPFLGIDEFRSRLRSRLLQVLSRRQFCFVRLWVDTYARMPVFAQ